MVFGVPEAWRLVRLDDNMGHNTLGLLVRSEDELALVIVQTVQAIHDTLLDRRADAALRISGGLASSTWESPITEVTQGGEPAFVKRGRGVLRARRVSLLQLRLRIPSAREGPRTLQLLGVLPDDAPPEQRARYLAALASFRYTRAPSESGSAGTSR